MVRSSGRKATQKGVALAQGCETAEASYDARIWAEWRGGMGGVEQEYGWSGAGGWAERREGMGGSNEKDAVLRGRTRRLQTLNSVWKGNYCSGIGDGGAIKSTKQREASAVPYLFVMVIPSVMKLSSPK